jgi:hypothetical protein
MSSSSLRLGLVTTVAIFAFLVVQNNCTALPVDLGMAGPEHRVGTGTIRNQSHSTGATRHRNGAPMTSKSGIIGHIGFGENSLLDQARLDAGAASAAASALAPTSRLHQINLRRGRTLTLDAGVYDLAKLQLNRATLTLSGSGNFVFNISSTFALRSARVLLARGATEAHVFFNYTGTRNVTLSGSRRHGGSVLHGIILALNAKVNLSPGLVVGEIIRGNNVSVPSSAGLPSTAVGVPEGSSSTILLSLIGLAALVAFRSFVIHPTNR